MAGDDGRRQQRRGTHLRKAVHFTSSRCTVCYARSRSGWPGGTARRDTCQLPFEHCELLAI